MEFNVELGARLRKARRAKGWSLLEVEDLTEGDFKASVVGAYERGERSLSVHRLCKLADIYEVPAGSLLPAPWDRADAPLVIDLAKAEQLEEGQAMGMERFLNAIQAMRRDAGQRGMAVRQSDLHIVNAFLANEVSEPQSVFKGD